MEIPLPTRLGKRRFCLVACAGVALVVLATWWAGPRGDARFVGRWQWDQTVLHLHEDLSAGVASSGPVTMPFTVPSRWWVEGNVLVVEQFADRSVRTFLRNQWRRITRPREPETRWLRFYVERVEPDRLTCRYLGNDGVTPLEFEYTLERLPE